MADETSEKHPSPAKSGRKKLFLILTFIVVALASAAGWYVLKGKTEPAPVAEVDPGEPLPDSPKKQLEKQMKKTKEDLLEQREETETRLLKMGQIPGGNILVPLTRQAVAYQPIDWQWYKRGDKHRIMFADLGRTVNKLTQVAYPDRIVVNLAESTGNAVLVLELAMRVQHLSAITRINERNHRLFDRIITVVSKKTQIEANRATFQGKLQQDLLSEINLILGYGTVSELVFLRFRLD